MKKEDELFSLIKSLSGTEKKNFKQYVSINNLSERSNYLVLFDYLDTSNEYNIKSLKIALSKYKFIKHLNVTKNYLFNLILESIYYYDHQTIPLFRLRKKIFYIKILVSKKQYLQAKKLLNKIKIEAIKMEYSNILLEIFEVEKNLFKIFPDSSYSKLKELYQEKFLHSEAINAALTYDFLISEMEQYTEIKGIPLNKQNDFDEFKEKFEYRMNNLNQIDYTSKVKESRLNALGRYYAILIEDKKALDIFLQLLDHYDNNPHLLIYREIIYAVNLINIIVVYIELNDLNSCNKYFEKLRKYINSLSPKIKRYNPYIYSASFFSIELYKDIHFGIFNPESESLKELDNNIIKRQTIDKTTDLMNMHLLIYYYFGVNNYTRSIFWYDNLLKYRKEGIRLDCFHASTLIVIIIHHELNNFDLVDSLLNSSAFNNAIDNEYQEFNKIFKKNMFKLTKEVGIESKRKIYKEFLYEIDQYYKKYPLKLEMLNLFNITKFLESKVNNISFANCEYMKVS